MSTDVAMDLNRMPDADPVETAEWEESLDAVLAQRGGYERVLFLLRRLIDRGRRRGVAVPAALNTPYVNTIPADKTPPYPGDRAIERRIKSLMRWNAVAMVVRANREFPGIGGHISTFQSAATLYQVGFHHYFRGKDAEGGGDQIFFQGHAAPGIYARAFLEGRLSADDLAHFRRRVRIGQQISSYPHPWLMPDFWEFPTVSMGLGAITAIYQARFNRYLQDRGIKDTDRQRVWCFLGDGETDEPETLGALTLASREGLDNLTFVVNCNLQRLDGPVRGNGKIIQELEAAFRGAGWNVIKVIWGSDWDPLLESPDADLLIERMTDALDGDYQRYCVQPGAETRQEFFGVHPRLLKLAESLTDEQILNMRRGGHDPVKVNAAYKAAVEHKGQPTVILAKTIKGYGLGEAGEGRNITHQQKKLNEQELRQFRDRFDIPIPNNKLAEMPFYKPPENSEEIRYLKERRAALGGFQPGRRVRVPGFTAPKLDKFAEFLGGTKDREAATTMSMVRILTRLMDDKEIGKLIVPIVPDEARTFGMDALFRKYGIYAHKGQLYDPVDSDLFLYYREAKDGQLLEEGITEAGSMGSFTAAGTAYATHGVNMIPFYFFYSMFGFQRVGDMIWAFADARGKGFLIGGTAGRTTLAGEGLQHQDGHSLVLSSVVPNCISYDAAYAYELAVIVQEGIRRMYEAREDVFYYLTCENETYLMPPMPEGPDVVEGILKGMYRFRTSPLAARDKGKPFVHLFGSGAILNGVLEAQRILAEEYDVSAEVWSVTSYTELRRDALECERHNRLHPEAPSRTPFIAQKLSQRPAPVVAASDYMKILPDGVAPWTPAGVVSLGTDGFGRSETRKALRRFFEVDAAHVVLAALHRLMKEGKVGRDVVSGAIGKLGIDPDAPSPAIS
ncbi:MAG: pyruvate dehydrogenase (acetyl-transferring), homodimeric type [Phycisphaerae bacterium]|nr:MAG: pyruvate dehydrogenase (acetyl-transferring), homodimeric type [Planctomycetota bacterium]KAB2949307.1 MAG: pyruvate dehydrogenase (acetyl-transferring), homodimeric type [Phycisphaerae bacterium]MBE7455308.1 pyruvate dehydrogenase (acetyl-transferring), homodimeric type [Planctomycetia bacterium]MCL4717706.1 pyruvate dehydrogenase (acetyl-transferring), homodimeric type [Phycisphaerae bacterium]MCQ3919752.1 pyruvate dehydrogenase (acetyl-transferring), homodimeric type [Planctomycetota